MGKYEGMSSEYLRETYIPDVYQPTIHAIDYSRLREAGITFLSFDVDDTIAPLEKLGPDKDAVLLFETLKAKGFTVVLLTNASAARAAEFAGRLGIPGQYIARAEKPLTKNFEELQKRFGVEKGQMAHVGNNIKADVASGNVFGVTTCLVRNIGILQNALDIVSRCRKEGHGLREELRERGLWRKHHLYERGDQYYQLGEVPAYRKREE